MKAGNLAASLGRMSFKLISTVEDLLLIASITVCKNGEASLSAVALLKNTETKRLLPAWLAGVLEFQSSW